TKARFLQTQMTQNRIAKPSQKTWTLALNILLWVHFSSLATNALLRCEQRNTEAPAYHLKHKTQRIAKMPSVANHS
ncbi:hypothetical protein, partial [Vibrio parahaemolyticus]|uniref:hypothetical protein n=1 Tax=Vibrio parahaemolyticus TaxID=670 RepID=UPI000B1C1600